VIYTRVSRDSAGGRSVEDQERECRAECDRRGWGVRAVYSDNSFGASRYAGDRPEWQKLKADLRQGDVLVLWEASRAQRDLEEFVDLRNQCAKLGVLLSYSGRVLDLAEGDDRFTGGLTPSWQSENRSRYGPECFVVSGLRQPRAGRVVVPLGDTCPPAR
jgi:site-specific DNA recombinase